MIFRQGTSIFDELPTEMKIQKNSKCRMRKWKIYFLPNSMSSTYKWSPSNFLQLWFFTITSKIFKFSKNCPQRWKIRKILSVGWESEKFIFFQIQCQVHSNDHRQIVYNFDIFGWGTSKFFKFSKNCPQRWKIRKILSVGWESEKFIFFQIQCQVYRNDPRQIPYNFDFCVR